MATIINDRIKELRLVLKFNQKDFANKFGISRGYLSEIEAGKTKPSIVLLVGISNFKEINPYYLSAEVDKPKFWDIDMDWLLTGEGSMFKEDKEEKLYIDRELDDLRRLLNTVYFKGNNEEKWTTLGFLSDITKRIELRKEEKKTESQAG